MTKTTRMPANITYPHPRLKLALAETLGVILFQEQVLKVACDLAGFTPGRGSCSAGRWGPSRLKRRSNIVEILLQTGLRVGELVAFFS